jgi:hypothetical protein
MSPPQRYDRHELPVALALSPLAVRCVVVHAWAELHSDGARDSGHQVYAVLCLLGRQAHGYRRRFDEHRPPRTAPTHDGMEGLGWVYDPIGATTEFDVVIHTEDYGLCDASFALDMENSVHEVVVCPWPEAEDAERLAPIIERLEAAARAKVERAERAGRLATANA